MFKTTGGRYSFIHIQGQVVKFVALSMESWRYKENPDYYTKKIMVNSLDPKYEVPYLLAITKFNPKTTLEDFIPWKATYNMVIRQTCEPKMVGLGCFKVTIIRNGEKDSKQEIEKDFLVKEEDIDSD